MSSKRNHYQVLGLSADVSAADIKRAYRKLAKTQHPDANLKLGRAERQAVTEEMMRINEAYETLIDAAKRADYDYKIGIGRKRLTGKESIFTAVDEDQQRERFLHTIFNPGRQAIGRLLNAYKKQILDLSADPYDDELMEKFLLYTDKLENALREASQGLTTNATPRSLEAAVQMMLYSIAQAADGLEELRTYAMNYDYDHLSMAENLFAISSDLSKQAFGLTKGR